MPFNIPTRTFAYWQETGLDPASDADIDVLEHILGGKAPGPYREFLIRYGAVEFDDEIDSMFDYEYRYPDRIETRSEAIAFIKRPQVALEYYQGLQKDPGVSMPPNLLPFAMNYGQGELLIEFGGSTERVFFWDFDSHDWERGSARLGFVADNLYDFINNLRPFDD